MSALFKKQYEYNVFMGGLVLFFLLIYTTVLKDMVI